MKVAEGLALSLGNEGVTCVFGLMGDANLSLLSYVTKVGYSRILHVRHEGSAVAMADGYFRASGEVGLATVTCGPGVTHIGSSLMAASRHGSPVVVVAGDLPRDAKGSGRGLQDMDQRRFAEASGALFHQLRSPETVAADVQIAFQLARKYRKPTILNCPLDIQDAEMAIPMPFEAPRSRADGPRAWPDPIAIERAGDMLAAAKRPLFVVGDGGVAAGVQDVVESLGNRVGAALATTIKAKGYLDGPWSVGICGTLATIPAEQLIGMADLVIMVGARGSLETAAAIPQRARTIQINLDRTVLVGHRPADLFILADARLALEAIDALLADADLTAPGFRTEAFAELFRIDPISADVAEAGREVPSGLVDPRLAMRHFDEALPTESTIVIGGGHFSAFPTTLLSGRRQRTFIYSSYVDFGCIGQALPIAFGAAVARPSRPVVVFEGDSSIFMHIHEFDTLARYKPKMLVVIMNDGALGAEYHKLESLGLDPSLAQFGSPDFAALAKAFGLASGRITALEHIKEEVMPFIADQTPRVIDVRTDVAVVRRSSRGA